MREGNIQVYIDRPYIKPAEAHIQMFRLRMGGYRMKLYLWITKDKYQLPLFVSDRATEVAKVSGVKVGSIYTITSKARRGLLKNPPFICVEVDAND